MNWKDKYPKNALPPTPFIGLFGNHHNNWRLFARELLVHEGVDDKLIYDSTDKGWEVVDDENGDSLQDWINELVHRQHCAMKQAKCLVFSLDGHDRVWPNKFSNDFVVPNSAPGNQRTLFAARWELGWLSGIQKPTFVWISDELQGRNYLRAAVKQYDYIKTFDTLVDATLAAAKFFVEDE